MIDRGGGGGGSGRNQACSVDDEYKLMSSNSSIRRSLTDNNSVPSQQQQQIFSNNRGEPIHQHHPHHSSGTINIGGGAGIPPLPRKSALKQNSGNMILLHKSPSSGGTNSFHAHLPPPEFADLPSPPPSISNLSHGSGGPHSRSSSHEMVGIGSSSDHQPLIMPSSSREGIQRDMDRSSFRTLPRQLRTTASGTTICPTSSPNPPPQQQHAHHNPMLVQHGQSATTPTNISSQAGSVVGPSCNIQLHHQTLPLKSNLKKPSGGSGGGSSNNSAPSSSANNTNAQQKLQWNQTSTSRSSLEELRV